MTAPIRLPNFRRHFRQSSRCENGLRIMALTLRKKYQEAQRGRSLASAMLEIVSNRKQM